MKCALTAERAREAENYTINNIKIMPLVLMEKAALSVTEVIEESFFLNEISVFILAGSGNNGADGLAIARILSEKGAKVSVFLKNAEHFSKEYESQKEILDNIDLDFPGSFEYVFDFWGKYDVAIDALFGTGLNRDVTGLDAVLIDNFNSLDAFKISVDIPSGLNATDGHIMGVSVKADATVTFGAYKTGLLRGDGPVNSGEVILKDIGLWYQIDSSRDALVLEDSDLIERLPVSVLNAHKGTYGKTLIIAGSENMYGAAYFAAKASLMSGAGMVKIITHENNRISLQREIPEALFSFYDKTVNEEELSESVKWADSIVIGPGLGKGDTSKILLKTLVSECSLISKVLIMDADAINLLSEDKKLFISLSEKLKAEAVKCVITPHEGELKRLTTSISPDTEADIYDKYGIYLIKKSARTEIFGDLHFINLTGNDGMATAGSGDVLSGILGGILFRLLNGPSFSDACATAVYLHGMAGDIAKEELGKTSMTAGDILSSISTAFERLNEL